jgi:hypothetical protein
MAMYFDHKQHFLWVTGFPLIQIDKLLPYSHSSDTEIGREYVLPHCQSWCKFCVALIPH